MYAYLTQCRPDLCIIEGGEEEEEDHDEEEFILIDEENEEDVFQRPRSSGDDWEVSVFICVSHDNYSVQFDEARSRCFHLVHCSAV